ncbi:MAG: hypothetical protein A2Z65_05225 [Gallionellales bacterium RIFCSPLOWO2_02_58_13]|nr:MAG: hypothetical protein A3H31_03770 [Gallionellales bacterium RIFCSPLOWO2_02_FULL_57_47]OGT04938.1 MAG: hypothetical protein A2Z65_05225 [Gallionellales bacterium RIFCSPLOWO2_02_58_13]OGT07933.1 MAG: hypothetical protein A3J49_14790 [Gallionellales bacterium RIFCSPHIGHO2_02_FULL_57_16]
MSEQINVPTEAQVNSLRSLVQVVYVLYALSYFAGITAIVGIIINYVKKDEAAGTWLESHFRWQIRTFWFGLLWAVIGAATLVIAVGVAILFANFCWIIYRIVKGWLNLNDNKPMIF